MPKIEIDGITVEADQGAMIIEVADRLAIPIPRFCYHRKLSIAANCRMCLVHVEKAPKPLPACATPITDGMKVWTKDKDAIAAQRSVMEFLLINHPLDCPVCDQGGECELQDVSLTYGSDHSRYDQPKRAVLDQNLGPLIATEMTRCIHCTRCVRFGSEISGERELGATGRSEFMEIGTFVEQNVNSEVSGNVIDLCPVGALTSKPFRFKARAWELTEKGSISPHDCIGSNLYVHTLNEVVMRVVPKEKEELNEVWLSDRDRFSYEGMLHEDRLRKCMLRKQDKWSMVSWVEALKFALAGLKLTIETYGVEKLGVLVSPSVTTEEYYLLQKFSRAIGGNNIDHRLRQLDFDSQELAPLYPNLGIEFQELSKQDSVLLIGCYIAKEQPLAALRLQHAAKSGAVVSAINPVDFQYNFTVTNKAIVPADKLVATVAGVAKAVLDLTKYMNNKSASNALANIKPNQQQIDIANAMLTGKKRQIILGKLALMNPHASQLIALSNLLATMVDGHCGSFSDGANAAGAWLTGCVPHRELDGKPCVKPGLNALQMLQQPLNCYVLYAIEPEFDSIIGKQALETIAQADFVIAISSYQSDALLEIADLILPLAMFAENDGSMVNLNGTVQKISQIIPPYGESRPGWKILRVLGSLAELSGFEYKNLESVQDEMWAQISIPDALPQWQMPTVWNLNTSQESELIRIAPISLYAVDALVRRANSLQATRDAHLQPNIEMNNNTAQHLNVSDKETVKVISNGNTVLLNVAINNRLADHTVSIYQANEHTLNLGTPYNKVEVVKC